VKTFAIGLLILVGWIVVFYVPVLWVMWKAKRARDKYEAEAKEPFTDLPMRLPRESTQKKADENFEKAIERLVLLGAACALAGFSVAMAPNGKQFVLAVTFAVLLGGFALVLSPARVQRITYQLEQKCRPEQKG
jgi:hypothetical protein